MSFWVIFSTWFKIFYRSQKKIIKFMNCVWFCHRCNLLKSDPLQYAYSYWNLFNIFLFATLSSLAIPNNKNFFILNSVKTELDSLAYETNLHVHKRRGNGASSTYFSFSLLLLFSQEKIRKSAITRHEKWEKCCARGAHRNEIFMDQDISHFMQFCNHIMRVLRRWFWHHGTFWIK